MGKCKFCNSEIEKNLIPGGTKYEITCPLCGYYQITDSADMCQFSTPPEKRDLALFCGYLRNNSSRKNPIIIFSQNLNTISEIIAPYKRMTVLDKINMFVRYLGDTLGYLGDRIQINDNDYTRFYLFNADELAHISNYLENRGVIPENPYPMCGLTVDGWRAYQELKQINIASKKAFVAMSFDKDLKFILDDAIVPACTECEFIASRVDSEEHTGKICDKIIADIKESRFVIADFTGQRQGVYFEAGFAQGLGIKVIWTCKEGEKEKLHFDTRQYSHILWKDAEDLKKQLVNKIRAVIK